MYATIRFAITQLQAQLEASKDYSFSKCPNIANPGTVYTYGLPEQESAETYRGDVTLTILLTLNPSGSSQVVRQPYS